MKEVVDLVVGGEETLCLPRRLEPLHLSFASARRLVRVLRPIVEPLVPAVLNAGDQLPLRRAVAAEFVGDHHTQRPALPLQQLAEQALGGGLITPAWTNTSSTMPSWSTARHSQCFLPAIFTTTSSRCH